MSTERTGVRLALAALALGLAAGLGAGGALTMSPWFFGGAAAALLGALAAWFVPLHGRSDDEEDEERPARAASGSPGFTREAYAFREWEARPAAASEAAEYPVRLAREVLDAPRVYGSTEAPPMAAAHAPPPATATRHWPPGSTPAPAAFRAPAADEELVEFQLVNTAPAVPLRGAPPPPARPTARAPTRPHVPAPVPGAPRFAAGFDGSPNAAFYAPRKPRYEKEELSREMQRRRERMARDLPLVGAMLVDGPARERPEVPEGKTRGRCGQCSATLWAPAKRPLRLRCPKCGHEARLT